MARRDRYEVAPTPAAARRAGKRAWRLTRNGRILGYGDRQDETVATGAQFARLRWEVRRLRGELVIKRPDGEIRDSRTYGADPRDIPG